MTLVLIGTAYVDINQETTSLWPKSFECIWWASNQFQLMLYIVPLNKH